MEVMAYFKGRWKYDAKRDEFDGSIDNSVLQRRELEQGYTDDDVCDVDLQLI